MSEEEPSYPIGAAGFGARLGMARRALGTLRQRDVPKSELGDAIGVSGQQVGFWESGENKTDIDTIERLATILRVNPGWLAFGVPPMKLPAPLRSQPDEAETPGLDMIRARRLADALSPVEPPRDTRRKRRGR